MCRHEGSQWMEGRKPGSGRRDQTGRRCDDDDDDDDDGDDDELLPGWKTKKEHLTSSVRHLTLSQKTLNWLLYLLAEEPNSRVCGENEPISLQQPTTPLLP